MIDHKKSIPQKRIYASIIDLTMVLVPAFLTRSRFQDPGFGFMLVTWIDLVVVCCVLPVITRGKTIGDSVFRIRLVGLDDAGIPPAKLLLRNAIYAAYLGIALGEMDDHIFFVAAMVGFVASFLSILSRNNKFSENLSTLDFIFKTKYKLG